MRRIKSWVRTPEFGTALLDGDGHGRGGFVSQYKVGIEDVIED